MGRRGPRPDPTALRLLKGNPSKTRISPREPRPKPGMPTVPTFLDVAAKREWRRVSRELRLLGLIALIDRAALAGYCQAWSRWAAAEEKVKEFGMVIKSPSGFPVQSPYLGIANTAMKHMRNFLAEFGMSPAARTRIESEGPTVVPLHSVKTGTDGPKTERFFHD